MLKGGNPLTVGVGIVIEVIRKNNSDYDPDVGAEANSIPSSRDPIYLGTLLRMFAQRVPDFMELILSPNHTIGGGDGPVTIRRKELRAAFGGKIEPLGFDRFKTCELMAELLHCSNMGLLNEIGSEEFVKARDSERERLKAEGKLGPSSHRGSHTDDDLTMKSSIQTRLGSSPEGSRKLEVQNVTDEDGFEEVTHAADLGDDAKDDFDEKPESGDLLASTKPETPLSFLDKDDDEFVDEPLSSPRLNTEKDLPEPQAPDVPNPLTPLSPTGELAQEVQAIGLEEDTHMADTHTEDSDPSTTESSKNSPGSSEDSTETPPAAEEEKPAESQPILSGLPETIPPAEPMDEVLHPEDKPAPLFAKKTEPSPEVAYRIPESHSSAESLDTTMGEAGDSSNSIMMGNTEEHIHQPLTEVPSTPVVGDFLKMQFVEHKVVPTILVS